MKQEGMTLGTKVAIGATVLALGGGALLMSFGTPTVQTATPTAPTFKAPDLPSGKALGSPCAAASECAPVATRTVACAGSPAVCKLTCPNGESCSEGLYCAAEAPRYCESKKAAGVSCATAAECRGGACVGDPKTCSCSATEACPTGKVCNSAHACVTPAAEHQSCGPTLPCAATTAQGRAMTCNGGTCTATCSASNACPTVAGRPATCVDSKCYYQCRPSATARNGSTDCASGTYCAGALLYASGSATPVSNTHAPYCVAKATNHCMPQSLNESCDANTDCSLGGTLPWKSDTAAANGVRPSNYQCSESPRGSGPWPFTRHCGIGQNHYCGGAMPDDCRPGYPNRNGGNCPVPVP